jgi:hypothetical protein
LQSFGIQVIGKPGLQGEAPRARQVHRVVLGYLGGFLEGARAIDHHAGAGAIAGLAGRQERAACEENALVLEVAPVFEVGLQSCQTGSMLAAGSGIMR